MRISIQTLRKSVTLCKQVQRKRAQSCVASQESVRCETRQKCTRAKCVHSQQKEIESATTDLNKNAAMLVISLLSVSMLNLGNE